MKINVAVLFGGKSVEHEISIISAVQAMANIDNEKYELFPIYITKAGEFYYGEALKEIEAYRDIPALLGRCRRVGLLSEDGKTVLTATKKKLFESKPIAIIDVALPIVHGTNVEDGALQGWLKTLNLPFAGCDVLASAVCMDKYAMKTLLKAGGFPVLDGKRYTAAEYADAPGLMEKIETDFSYPVIVKPINLGSSIGISRAKERTELADALELAFTFAGSVIVEPNIVNLKEINCAVLGDCEEAEASECEEPIASDGILSYSDKYMEGEKKGGNMPLKGGATGFKTGSAMKGGGKGAASAKRRIPADIPGETRQKIREIAVSAFQYLDCSGVARIDFMIDEDTGEIWLNELNTIPGSLAFYLWEPVGIDYKTLGDRLINLALRRQRRQADLTYSFEGNIFA